MALNHDVAFLSVEEHARRLRRGDYSSVELTDFFLERCETIGPKWNAVVTLTRELAEQQARQADQELARGRDRGVLHGIPYGVKDLLATKGYSTTWGAEPFRKQQIDRDAFVIQKLTEAGAVLVAKLSMVELAGGMGYQQANAAFNGPGRNPWNRDRWSGGSSSGPGSAVGGGLVPFAIGSETWGSILTPCAYCGITGLRPTYGRVSRSGAMALSWTMDKLGPMGRTARDCGHVLNAIAGHDPDDPSSREMTFDYQPNQARKISRRRKLATISGVAEHVQAEVRENYLASLQVLQEFCDIEETSLPEDLPYNTVADLIISAEAAAAFGTLIDSGELESLTAEEDRWRLLADMTIPAADYINALRIRRKIQQALETFLSRYDAVIAPTLATVAGPVDRPFSEWSRGFSSISLGGASNVAGLPAVAVPNGFDQENLPTGIQFVGRAFGEQTLLNLAEEFQARTKWHQVFPE